MGWGLFRANYISASSREHVRRVVRGVGVHGVLVAFGSTDFYHERSAQDFECRWIVARRAITCGSFVIDHHPTLHRSQRRREATGGGDVMMRLPKYPGVLD